MAEGFFRYYQLPLSLEELTVVTSRFHLKPLLALFNEDGQYYILALSQGQYGSLSVPGTE